MSRKNPRFQYYGFEEEDPKIKFNSLLSGVVSTIMCLAAKCPLPKSNVETTKLFLSKITDDNGKPPRNVRGFLSLLQDYSGPYDGDLCLARYEKPAEEPSVDDMALAPKETVSRFLGCEKTSTDAPLPTKRTTRILIRKTEKEMIRKTTRNSGTKVSPSKSVISSKP